MSPHQQTPSKLGSILWYHVAAAWNICSSFHRSLLASETAVRAIYIHQIKKPLLGQAVFS
ncbi:MAG: hypothetical protein WC654_04790 [Patescibacteria group bacterium]